MDGRLVGETIGLSFAGFPTTLGTWCEVFSDLDLGMLNFGLSGCCLATCKCNGAAAAYPQEQYGQTNFAFVL